MRLPQRMHSRPSVSGQPIFARGMAANLSVQGLFDWVNVARCTAACAGRRGTVACVARCVATGQVCDAGTENCTGL